MRLVRGSILSSTPCSLSKAARILRRFLSSDAGTHASVKSFLKKSAASLESMRDAERSSLIKPKKKRRRLDHENSTSVDPKEEALGFSFEGQDIQERATVPETEEVKQGNKRRKSSKPLLEEHLDDIPYMDANADSAVTKRFTGEKRNNDRRHSDRERGDGLQRSLTVAEEKTESELNETPGPQKKSKKIRTPDAVILTGSGEEERVDAKGALRKKRKHQTPLEEDKDLVLLNSEKSDDPVEEGNDIRHSIKITSGPTVEVKVDEEDHHHKKKKKKEKTPKSRAEPYSEAEIKVAFRAKAKEYRPD
eukprot:Gb_04050 [translate_table: standard]